MEMQKELARVPIGPKSNREVALYEALEALRTTPEIQAIAAKEREELLLKGATSLPRGYFKARYRDQEGQEWLAAVILVEE